MRKHYFISAPLFVLTCLGTAHAQEYPVADMAADNVVTKYKNSSCEQLWQERAQKQGMPKSPREQEMIKLLKGSPEIRTYFINKIAAPVLNKMFECGIIP